VVIPEVVSKDVAAIENGSKARTIRKYSHTRLKAKLWSECLWVRGSCWGKGIELELANKAWAHKKKPLIASFPSHLLKAFESNPFLYALSPRHKRAKWNTIEVAKGTNAKLPHCMGLVLAYLMEYEMPLVHHTAKWWGCGYPIKDNKGLNERTQKHSMLKPMFKLMQARWE
jgi:hypothetical protein